MVSVSEWVAGSALRIVTEAFFRAFGSANLVDVLAVNAPKTELFQRL